MPSTEILAHQSGLRMSQLAMNTIIENSLFTWLIIIKVKMADTLPVCQAVCLGLLRAKKPAC